MASETVTYSEIDEKYAALGIAVVVLGFIAGIILQMTRRIRNMPSYFLANFLFFKGNQKCNSDKNSKFTIVASILYYLLLCTPVLLLIAWVIALGIKYGPNPALPILFIGIFVLLIFLPSHSNLFYYKVLGMFLAYLTAELLVLGLNFVQEDSNSFWALTALCLTINSVFVIICQWFIDGTTWSIPDNTPESLKKLIKNHVKIWKEDQVPEIIDGGLYGRMDNLSLLSRVTIISIIYLISLAVLTIYSCIGKFKTLSNYQALVNSVAIVSTDIISFMLIFVSKKTGFNPNMNTIVVIAVRACVIAFSGNFWFLGYCLLYLILMFYISIMIVSKYYPIYEKPPSIEVTRTNIFKMPEASALFLLIMFSLLVYYVGQDGGKTLPVTSVYIGASLYPFWSVGVVTILLSFSVLFYLVTLRIVERSQVKIRSLHIYYLGCEGCGEYYFFLFTSYIFLVILGCYLYTVTGNDLIWASCVFLPIFYQAFVIFYLNWQENDFLLFGDMAAFNRKIKKKKEREVKINQMKGSMIKKMQEEGQSGSEMLILESTNLRVMDGAIIEDNLVLANFEEESNYSEWRQQMNVIEAFRENKLLPTDKKILISIPIMLAILIAYSIAFFYSENRDMTAFTVSVEIIVLFLIFIPTKRYFCTFENPSLSQILMFTSGLILNYGFGILSYVLYWNNSPAYTLFWCIINLFLVITYAAFSLIRDKGLIFPSIITAVFSMVLSFGTGVILLVWFNSLVVGIALIGAAFFYTYFTSVYLVYRKMNNSVPFVIYPITLFIIIGSCIVVMIYSFVSPDFDDFYGFSITYLVINLLGLIYAIYRIGSDIMTRNEKPNFYSPYGSPIYKYNSSINSAVENILPIQLWLGFWFMFYSYTIMMQIFMKDTMYGTSTSMIPFIVFSCTFIDITTYNLYRAGKVKADITEDILTKSWNEVVKNQDRSLGNFINLSELESELEDILIRKQNGEGTIQTNTVKIGPNLEAHVEEMNKTTTSMGNGNKISVDIDYVIYDIENKIEKAKQNDKILLVNFWTSIIFKTESVRKKRMLGYLNFIRDCGDILAQVGITLVINDSLYDIEDVYNQAYQEIETLSPLQKIFFSKELKNYLEKKEKHEKEKEEVSQKESENEIKRLKELEKRLEKNDKENYYPNVPLEKMKDGPEKLEKLKQTLGTSIFTDPDFPSNNDIVPAEVRGEIKGWKRPSKNSFPLKSEIEAGMSVKQGMIGNCYLISAIGVLGKNRIRGIITDPSLCPSGAYMVKFNKFSKDIYVIVDDSFPVYDVNGDNNWIFGRSEDPNEVFCNIIEKAYAKLYGGYQNIVGGKVALALSDMTGGFPEEIELKPYQETNTTEIFEKMVEFHKAGYLMGAGSPPNPKGDSVEIDGIYQGHAYLVINVRDLDGNKLIKLRNPHGNESRESTLDWSDDSPKWTNRLKGLLGEQMSNDGAFWIGLEDFVYCFRALYICRIFDETWTRIGPFKGVWKDKKAAGLKAQTGAAILENNPHYGIKVSKACTLFVELTQNETEENRAKNKIFFMVQKNSGKRIQAPSTSKMSGMSGAAINSRTITKEIQLTADSFPYTFSLMVAIYESGVEGSYSLSMYCNDPSIKVIEDDSFDV